jgi:TetR/AcrR family transcriptional regulator, cholesterol catabolism regulator
MTNGSGYGQRGAHATRERVMQATAAVLATRGYAGTTLKEIAEVAGTKTGSLYYYFSGREDLISELMTRGITETIASVESAEADLPSEATARDRLMAAIAAYVRVVLTDSTIARASIRALGQVPAHVEEPAIAMHRTFGRHLHDLIEAAQFEGYLSKQVDARILRLLLAGAVNWSPEWFQPDGPSSVDDVATLAGLLALGEIR